MPRLSLAPMEGVTTFLYRNLFHEHFGGFDAYYTPFLSNANLSTKDIKEISPEFNKVPNLVPQILTNRTDLFFAIVEHLQEYGYTEVNFNLGCPSGTVVSKKRGAGMLSDPDFLDQFLEEIFDKCPISVSIKTRIGIRDLEEWDTLLPIYQKYPLKELIIHPRLQKEFYQGVPHVEAYLQAIEGSPFPLCYNGNITSLESYQQLLEKNPSCEHIMIGRGAIANPSLPGTLKRGEAAPLLPSNVSEKKKLRAFHDALLQAYRENMQGGELQALFKMKELWVYMGEFAGASEKEIKKLRKTTKMQEYQAIVQSILS